MNGSYVKSKHRFCSAGTGARTILLSSLMWRKRKQKLKCEKSTIVHFVSDIQHFQRRDSSCYKGKPIVKLRVAPGRAQGDCADDPNLKINLKLKVKRKLFCSQNLFDHRPSESKFGLPTLILTQIKHKLDEHKNLFGWIQTESLRTSPENSAKSINGLAEKCRNPSLNENACKNQMAVVNWKTPEKFTGNTRGENIETDLFCITKDWSANTARQLFPCSEAKLL